MTMVALALFHHASRKIGRPMDPMSISNTQFNTFRIEDYDPVTPLVHWKTPKPNTFSIAIDSWNHSNKPNTKDFAVFKDNACWIHAKEHLQTTLDAQGLLHLIDEGHVVTNPQLGANQHAWLFKILQDVMQQPVCKAIVIDHLGNKDTVRIWKKICEAMGMSMTAQFTSQSISTYLTSMRPLPTTGW
jgi:hypothetical protein